MDKTAMVVQKMKLIQDDLLTLRTIHSYFGMVSLEQISSSF
jgi:hypothetical protein